MGLQNPNINAHANMAGSILKSLDAEATDYTASLSISDDLQSILVDLDSQLVAIDANDQYSVHGKATAKNKALVDGWEKLVKTYTARKDNIIKQRDQLLARMKLSDVDLDDPKLYDRAVKLYDRLSGLKSTELLTTYMNAIQSPPYDDKLLFFAVAERGALDYPLNQPLLSKQMIEAGTKIRLEVEQPDLLKKIKILETHAKLISDMSSSILQSMKSAGLVSGVSLNPLDKSIVSQELHFIQDQYAQISLSAEKGDPWAKARKAALDSAG